MWDTCLDSRFAHNRSPASEGADLHCEPKALGLRALRIFEWLDQTLKV